MRKKVVFVPGLAMRGLEYKEVMRLVEAEGFDCLCFDNPFVGNGPRDIRLSGESLSIFDQAQYQWSEVGKLQLRPDEQIAVFGLSMGGMIASTMFVQQPGRVSHLVVAATSPNHFPLTEAIAAPTAEKWMNARTIEQLAESIDPAFGTTTKTHAQHIRDSYLAYRASGSNAQSRSDFGKQMDAIRSFNGVNIYSKCRELNANALVISAEEDELFPNPHSEEIRALLGSQSLEIKLAGHMLHLEAPVALAELIVDFLRGPERERTC